MYSSPHDRAPVGRTHSKRFTGARRPQVLPRSQKKLGGLWDVPTMVWRQVGWRRGPFDGEKGKALLLLPTRGARSPQTTYRTRRLPGLQTLLGILLSAQQPSSADLCCYLKANKRNKTQPRKPSRCLTDSFRIQGCRRASARVPLQSWRQRAAERLVITELPRPAPRRPVPLGITDVVVPGGGWARSALGVVRRAVGPRGRAWPQWRVQS